MRRGLAVLAAAAVLLAGCTSSSVPGSGNAGTGGASSHGSASPTDPRPAGESTLTLTVNGSPRQVLMERPTSGIHHRPLVIFLHGARNNPQIIRDSLKINQQAAQAGVIVAFPDGDPVHHSWHIGCCNAFASDPRDFDFMTTLIHTLVASGEVDPQHIVLAGFSAGGLFADNFACRDPQLVRAVVVVAGYPSVVPKFVTSASPNRPRCAPSRPVTVLHVQGRIDNAVPLAGVSTGCDATPCGPGVKGYVPSAQTVYSWWQQLDGCAPPVQRRNGPTDISIATCRDGTRAGLAVVDGVRHDVAGISAVFDLRGTLIQLATGSPLAAW